MSMYLSERARFSDIDWTTVPAEPGVYVIYDDDEVVYVGMAGRNGQGSLRNRLRDHASRHGAPISRTGRGVLGPRACMS
jgi:excinuclease UvrABC nuclease subunit